jgi:hypothetical protein
MKPVVALSFAVGLALAGTAFAVDVYKWKDSKGVVHYGDRPASGVAAATISVHDDAPSPEDEAAANERLEQAHAKLAESSDDDDAPVAPPPPPPPRKKQASYDCTESWHRYEAAQACYASHRNPNGKGVSPAGMALCRPMPEPSCER